MIPTNIRHLHSMSRYLAGAHVGYPYIYIYILTGHRKPAGILILGAPRHNSKPKTLKPKACRGVLHSRQKRQRHNAPGIGTDQMLGETAATADFCRVGN